MEIIPFGEVLKDRFELSKKYNLIENIGGFWRVTKKCKENYNPESYVYYLRGKIEKPTKEEIQKQQNVTVKTIITPLDELLAM